MFCKKCGAKLQDGVKFCQNCGTACEQDQIVEQVSDSSNVSTVNENLGNSPSIGTSVQSNNNKKKDLIFIIVIVIIGIALIAVPIILNFSKSESAKSTNSNRGSNSNSTFNTNTNSNSGITTNGNTNSNSNSTSNTNSNSNNQAGTKEVTLGNYTLKIPATSTTELDEDGLYIYGLRTSADIGMILIQEGDYEQLKTSKELVKTYMQMSGFTVEDVDVAVYNGVEFITMKVSQPGYSYSMVCGYAKISDTEIASVLVMNESYTADYTLLNEMATIVSSAKKAGASGM